jgi:hypothetical protein
MLWLELRVENKVRPVVLLVAGLLPFIISFFNLGTLMTGNLKKAEVEPFLILLIMVSLVSTRYDIHQFLQNMRRGCEAG